MGAKSRKRPRKDGDDAPFAECPFSVTIREIRPPTTPKHQGKTGPPQGVLVQAAPFHPVGKFKTHGSLDVAYTIEPKKEWTSMTRYSSFVLNGAKYINNDYVYITNHRTVGRQNKRAKAPDDEHDDIQKAGEHWVARLLEIRAADEEHVYARICWMYRPEELPAAVMGGKKTAAGRHPHHGTNELIASNHMDVINVISVAMPARVRDWVGAAGGEGQDALYWRQALDCLAGELSTVEAVCQCVQPANPDHVLVGCTNDECKEWMHYDCLLDDVLTRVYDDLGADKPHVPDTKASTGQDTTQRQSSAADAAPVKSRAKGSPLAAPTPAHPRRRRAARKLCEGLFEATLRVDRGPARWEMQDLRNDVDGGDKTWTERVSCLVCGADLV